MKASENRVDPSELSDKEMDQLQPILDFAERNRKAFLKGSDGSEYPLPEPIFDILVRIASGMRHGQAMLIMPEDETFTTQAAANYLGMSRQFFVTLLESGKIPFHRVGAHRRVYFKDLRAYANNRDKDRRAGLSQLFKKLQDEYGYDVELSEVTDNAE
jgi:excisionase family DNA binding protein